MTRELDILTGQLVTQIRVDHALTLLGEGDLLRIGGSIQYSRPGEPLRQVRVEDRPQDAAVLLDRLHRRVDAGTYSDGRLDLSFEDGARILVSDDPEYEAWELTRGDGSKLVCNPGGGLAIWGPASTDPS